MHEGDQHYEQAMKTASQKAQYKVANLMKHGYTMHEHDTAIVLSRDDDKLVILPNGDVYKKVMY